MAKRPKYTAAVIGTGRIGFSLGFDKKREQPASHTMALLANKRIKLIAGCDNDATHLEDWHRYCRRVAVYSSYGYLFAACKPDIVVVAVNEDAHLETALAAIKSIPRLVILEKPVALNMKDGLTIADAARKYDVPVLVNHERRFALDYTAAKEYMSKIGDIQSITAELSSGMRVYSPADEKTGAYSLLHDGTHLVDIIMYLLEGDISDASARRSILYDAKIVDVFYDKDNNSVVRNISVHFMSDKCSDITMRMSGRSKYFGFDVDVRGTEGRIRIGNGYAEFYKRAESKLYSGFYSLTPDKSIYLPVKTHYFSNMVKNAVAFLDGKEQLKSTLQTGLNALDVLEQIKRELSR